ncbi:MAG: hypothetical protein L0Z07_08365, partial [Planctomycetes bacterium]|nr:hypothetical protein [Planctomycetota bacterium]
RLPLNARSVANYRSMPAIQLSHFRESSANHRRDDATVTDCHYMNRAASHTDGNRRQLDAVPAAIWC